METIAYVHNGHAGRYVPRRFAAVSAEDRGLLFADGVYEVVLFRGGAFMEWAAHWQRFEHSLKEIRLDCPVGEATVKIILQEIIRQSRLSQRDVVLYFHATRGSAARKHDFPSQPRPAFLALAYPYKPPSALALKHGVKVAIANDERWKRCDIKSISLLPNVLAKQLGHDQGAAECWLLNDAGEVTEGAAANAWIVDAKGTLRTHPKTHAILGGVTRAAIMELAKQAGISVEERAFTLKEVATAKEAFLSLSTIGILPVSQVEEHPLPDARPITQQLMAAFEAMRNRQIII